MSIRLSRDDPDRDDPNTDEIVAKNVDIHLERVDTGAVWMNIYDGDYKVSVNMTSDTPIRVTAERGVT